jgi:hypothetical protein
MCKINNNCKVEIELYQSWHSEPIKQWEKRTCKEDFIIRVINGAYEKLLKQASEECDEIHVPSLLVDHWTPQDKFEEYDEFGEGIGEPTGMTGDFCLGFYLSTVGTKNNKELK